MGFLSDAWKTITKIAETPIKTLSQADPLARALRPALKRIGFKDSPAESFINQLHRDTRSQYGQAALPVVGGILGTVFIGPGYGTALGAAGGRAIAGAERGESDTGIVKNAAITGATTYAGAAAGGYAGGLGQTYGGMGGRIAAQTAASGGVAAGTQMAAGQRPTIQSVAPAMAGTLANTSVQGAMNSPSVSYPESMPDASPYMEPGNPELSRFAGGTAGTVASLGTRQILQSAPSQMGQVVNPFSPQAAANPMGQTEYEYDPYRTQKINASLKKRNLYQDLYNL